MQKIINLMLAMGYPIEEKGVCAGLTQMWQQAYASGGEVEEFKFFQRLDRINTLYGKGVITKNNIKARLAEVDEKVKAKIDLTEEDEFLLEIRAFFDSVCIYQSGYKAEIANTIFEGQVVTQRNLDILSSVAASIALEQKGGMAVVFSQPVVYSNNNLQGFFDDLANELQDDQMTDLSFSLSSGMHRIGIRYHPDEHKWSVIDPGSNLDYNLAYKKDSDGNPLTLAQAIQQNIKIPHEDIAKALSGSGLSFERNSAFNIKAITTKDNANIESIKNKFERLRTNNLNSLTEDQVSLSNRGISLTSLAIEHGHSDFLQKSAEKFPEEFKTNINLPTLDYGQLPFHAAYALGHNDMVEILCNNGTLKLINDDGNTEVRARYKNNDLAFLSYISRVAKAEDFTKKDLSALREPANKEALQRELIQYIRDKNASNEPIPLEELINFKNNLAIKPNKLFNNEIINNLPGDHPFIEENKREILLQAIENEISHLKRSRINFFHPTPNPKVDALIQLKINLTVADLKTQKTGDVLTAWENKTKEVLTIEQVVSLKRSIIKEPSRGTENTVITQRMFFGSKNRNKVDKPDSLEAENVKNPLKT